MCDSPKALILDARITQGEILSPSTPDRWESEIREQLSYLQRRPHLRVRHLFLLLLSGSGSMPLGNNIDVLTNLAQFKPGIYQIYFLNGCDTFTHLSTSLLEGSASANPGSAGSKYLDIITNAISSYFDQNSKEIMSLMHELGQKEKTYYQILDPLDARPERIVEGEQDNN